MAAWHEEPIDKRHDREGFDCGEETLNEFLRRYARKSHDMGGAKTFLAMDDADHTSILGFYSLGPASVDYARTPEIVRRGLARHEVPGFRLARMAVDRKVQGQGIGGQLLLAAGRRCLLASAEVGGVVLVIDAKNERVAGLVCQLWRRAAAGRAVVAAAAAGHHWGGAQESREILKGACPRSRTTSRRRLSACCRCCTPYFATRPAEAFETSFWCNVTV